MRVDVVGYPLEWWNIKRYQTKLNRRCSSILEEFPQSNKYIKTYLLPNVT